MNKFGENLAVILEHIASYDDGDIDSETIELRFEDEDGRDTGCDVDLREVCAEAAEKINSHDDLYEALEALVKDDHIPEWKRISINMLLKKARGES